MNKQAEIDQLQSKAMGGWLNRVQKARLIELLGGKK